MINAKKQRKNIMGKTSELFKEIRDTKRTFHAKISKIKTEMVWTQQKQKILRRGGKNTQKNYTKKYLNNPDKQKGVITHLEPDILECELKWALGSITMNKASGGDRIPAELFQILKNDVMKVLHLICQQIWKTQQRLQDLKRSVFISVPKKGNGKECSKYHTIALTSCASR